MRDLTLSLRSLCAASAAGSLAPNLSPGGIGVPFIGPDIFTFAGISRGALWLMPSGEAERSPGEELSDGYVGSNDVG